MKRTNAWIAFTAVMLAPASIFAAPSAPSATSAPSTLRIYDSTELALDSYVVIHRVGVGNLRSAIGIPGHRDEASARAAVLAEAARAGADGIINLQCMGQTDGLFRSAGHYCYGNAIRLSNERRVVPGR